MSWFPKFFGKKSTQPRDSQAPLKSLMSSAPKASGQMGENARMKRELLGSFKKGGVVKKTGAYKLHKGEEVIPAKKREMAGKMKIRSGKLKGYSRLTSCSKCGQRVENRMSCPSCGSKE